MRQPPAAFEGVNRPPAVVPAPPPLDRHQRVRGPRWPSAIPTASSASHGGPPNICPWPTPRPAWPPVARRQAHRRLPRLPVPEVARLGRTLAEAPSPRRGVEPLFGGSFRTGRGSVSGSGRFGTAHPPSSSFTRRGPHRRPARRRDRRTITDSVRPDVGLRLMALAARRLSPWWWSRPVAVARQAVAPVWPAWFLPPGRGRADLSSARPRRRRPGHRSVDRAGRREQTETMTRPHGWILTTTWTRPTSSHEIQDSRGRSPRRSRVAIGPL